MVVLLATKSALPVKGDALFSHFAVSPLSLADGKLLLSSLQNNPQTKANDRRDGIGGRSMEEGVLVKCSKRKEEF